LEENPRGGCVLKDSILWCERVMQSRDFAEVYERNVRADYTFRWTSCATAVQDKDGMTCCNTIELEFAGFGNRGVEEG